MKKLRAILTIGIMSGCILLPSAVSAGEKWLGDSFTAEWHDYNRHWGKDKHSINHVYVNKHIGMRREGKSGELNLITITQFKINKTYIIDVDRKIYAEIVDEKETGSHVADEVSGILSDKPCDGFPMRKKVGERKMKGFSVEVWDCTHPKYGRSSRLYDAKHRLLIFDEFTATGNISELKNIQFKESPLHLFKLPKGLKKVRIGKFYPRFPR